MKRCISFISIIGNYIIMFGSHNTFCWFYTRSESLHLVTYAWQRIISQDYKSAIITSSGTFIMPQLARNFHEIFNFQF